MLHTIVSVLIAFSVVAADDSELQTMVDAHSTTIASFAAIDFELEISGVSDSGAPTKVPVDWKSIYRWSKDGSKERWRYRNSPSYDDDGRPRHLGDLIIDGGTCKYLTNWDWDKPQQITPINQGTVKATIFPKTRESFFVIPDASVFLLLRFQLNNSLPVLSLRELVSENPGSTIEGRDDVDGHQTVKLRIPLPGGPRSKNHMHIWLDASVGYLARRVQMHTENPDNIPSLQQKRFAMDGDIVVKVFENVGDGIFFPRDVEVENRFKTEEIPEERVTTNRGVVKRLIVNKPLPVEAFDFRFPKDVLVRHLPPSDEGIRVELWGGNNRAVKQIRGVRDLDEFAVKSTPKCQPARWQMFLLVNGALVIAIVVFLWARKRRQTQ
jgi:hypothetical protein